MNRIKRLGCVLAACASVMLFASGCTDQQLTAAAQQAGVASVAAWFYASDQMPTAEQKAAVAGVISVVKASASNVVQGASYYQELYPKAVAWIDANVQEKDRMVAKIGAGWALVGINSFFAMHPQAESSQVKALKIATAYCDGVSLGLAMTKDSKLMKAIAPAAEKRRAMVGK